MDFDALAVCFTGAWWYSTCEASALLLFSLQPFYGGKKDRVTAEVFAPNDKRNPICSIQGEWNGVMVAKYDDGVSL